MTDLKSKTVNELETMKSDAIRDLNIIVKGYTQRGIDEARARYYEICAEIAERKTK